MKPKNFKQVNKIYSKPVGWTDEQYSSLPTYQHINQDGHPEIISCWEISDEELEKLKTTKCIWFLMVSNVQTPILLSVDSPFTVIQDELIICPHCNGYGQPTEKIKNGDDEWTDLTNDIPCLVCFGKGKILQSVALKIDEPDMPFVEENPSFKINDMIKDEVGNIYRINNLHELMFADKNKEKFTLLKRE